MCVYVEKGGRDEKDVVLSISFVEVEGMNGWSRMWKGGGLMLDRISRMGVS